MLESVLLSSLDKVYPDAVPSGEEYITDRALRNEPFSFQLAYRLPDGKRPVPVYVTVETALPVQTYRVDYVPLVYAGFPGEEDGAERTQAGLYPDPLMPRLTAPALMDDGFWCPRTFEDGQKYLLNAVSGCWQSLWLTVNEEGIALPAGEYPITVEVHAQEGRSLLATHTFTLKLVDADLPPQTLLYTNWLHSDCLADSHNVEIFSDRYFEILGQYAHTAALHGMNMVLLPAFTPALDTSVGRERRTAQLVGVTVTEDADGAHYAFDFSLMKRYMDVCRQAGTTHFEHCHLFTQWGAKAAPKILATVNGETRRIFGWDTDAAGEEYRRFLEAYIPAVRAFLRQEGAEDKTLFHISDEPNENMVEGYRAAQAIARPLLEGCLVGDALSHFEYYQQGLVQTPIVCTSAIEPFIGNCDHLWCYYTGAQFTDGLSNRLLNLPLHRNRILGLQMYRYDIQGFLNWGYNYAYDVLSHGWDDLFTHPSVFDRDPGGSFVVYPGRDGTAIPSIRLKVFADGINDMRALRLLESLTDRQSVCDLLDRLFGGRLTFRTVTASAEDYRRVRTAIFDAIEQNLPR